MLNIRRFFKGIGINPVSSSSADSIGELEVLSSDGSLQYHNGSTVAKVTTNTNTQSLSNKTIDADLNTITNIENADIKVGAAIDAAKIADGSVSNTEFQYLNGVTSDIQIQLNGKLGSSLTQDNIYVGNASNLAAAVDTTAVGDIEADSTNGLTIKADVIVNADINSAAAIARTKIANGTADHVVINNGSGTLSSEATLAKVRGGSGQDNSSITFPASGVLVTEAGTQTLTGKTIDADSNTITNIENADIKVGAAIARSKLASGSNNHVIINDGSGVMSSEAALAISRGGTGQTTASAALNALSPTTTKGDLIVRNSSTNDRLPIGTNGYVLTADSAETLGVKWAAAGGGSATVPKNYVINSNFDFWQRQTTFSTTASGNYTSDRYRVNYDGTIGAFTVSRQAFTVGQTDVPHEPSYYYRWDQTSAGSGSTVRSIQHRIESSRTLANKSVTVAFYAKADSARTVNVGMTQSFGTGGSPSADVGIATQSASLTTSWQRFVLTFSVPSISGKTLGTTDDGYLQVYWSLPVNTTMTIDLAQVLVAESQTDTSWSYASSGTQSLIHEMEFAACQRYYEKTYSDGVFAGSTASLNDAMSAPDTSNFAVNGCSYQVSKRINITYSTGDTNANAARTLIFYAPLTGTAQSITRISNSADAGINGCFQNKHHINYVTLGSQNSTSEIFSYNFISSAEL